MADRLSGLGEPGQRETTRAGLETGYSLVVRQVKMSVVWGWGIIFLLMAGVLAFWIRADATGCWRWLGAQWPWLFVSFIAWGVLPPALGIWRFFAEVADPTYPTPRAPIPDLQRDGPRWPWTREPLMYEEAEKIAQRIVHIELDSNGGRTRQYADLPDVVGLAGFARATANGRPFTVRTAQAFGISRTDFEAIRDVFLDRGWARWKGGDKRQGIEVLVAGRSVLRHLAAPSPTLLEVV